MKLEEFNYILDESKIAQKPKKPRHNSRLLIVDRRSGKTEDKIFHEIVNYLDNKSVIVFNETKVIKARLKGYIILKDGRKKEVEIFLLAQKTLNSWECAVFPGERLKIGKVVYFEDNENNKYKVDSRVKHENDNYISPLSSVDVGELQSKRVYPGVEGSGVRVSKLIGTIKEITYSGRIIEFNQGGVEFLDEIDKIGEIPLPPYIENKEQKIEDYNTVFAKEEGSAAAPTAGLHFSEELIEKLVKRGVKIEKIILHVGLGTFKTITTEIIENHEMHEEKIFINEETANKLNQYKKEGRKIIAVGTTVTRTLESFCNKNGELGFGEKNTNIFIYPGYKFKFIDELITNFHLPKSSLIILVSAFYDREKILEIYKESQEKNYRFFSFGDAIWIR